MVIHDLADAEFYLKQLNYYRLSAYWKPFEIGPQNHQFQPGTKFSDVLDRYIFDRELRLLVLDAIERIEVSIRSQWAYQMAHMHGPHSHLDPKLATNNKHWKSNYRTLEKEVHRSNEPFIEHLKATYEEPLPPVWAVCEVMSLGLLSRWYDNLKPMPTRRAIASGLRVDEFILESWLRHFSVLRNTCAHHSRLWNRRFTVTPALPKNIPKGLNSQFQQNSRTPYNSFVILAYCMDIIAPGHHFRVRLKALITKHNVHVEQMDFPAGWDQYPIWI